MLLSLKTLGTQLAARSKGSGDTLSGVSVSERGGPLASGVSRLVKVSNTAAALLDGELEQGRGHNHHFRRASLISCLNAIHRSLTEA